MLTEKSPASYDSVYTICVFVSPIYSQSAPVATHGEY